MAARVMYTTPNKLVSTRARKSSETYSLKRRNVAVSRIIDEYIEPAKNIYGAVDRVSCSSFIHRSSIFAAIPNAAMQRV